MRSESVISATILMAEQLDFEALGTKIFALQSN